MSLKSREKAPSFKLASTSGSFLDSETLKGQFYILYFFPKDFTPGCTAQACSFRDNFESFSDLNIPVYGISTDNIKSHLEFKDKYSLPFDLLSDKNGEISKKYKAYIPFIGISKRITYLIDDKGYIVEAYENMFNAKSHISNMLRKLGISLENNQ